MAPWHTIKVFETKKEEEQYLKDRPLLKIVDTQFDKSKKNIQSIKYKCEKKCHCIRTYKMVFPKE